LRPLIDRNLLGPLSLFALCLHTIRYAVSPKTFDMVPLISYVCANLFAGINVIAGHGPS